VQRFNTVMTGELFDLISTQSVLRFNSEINPKRITEINMARDAQISHDQQWQGQYDEVFIAAVKDHAQSPESLTANLFSIRARGLLNDTPNFKSHARLSGLLIAADVVSMQQYWQGRECVIVAKPSLAHLYRLALTTISDSDSTVVRERAMDDLSIKGLSAIAQQQQLY